MKFTVTRYPYIKIRHQAKGDVYIYRGTPQGASKRIDCHVLCPVKGHTLKDANELAQALEQQHQRPTAVSLRNTKVTELITKYIDAEERRFRYKEITFRTFKEKQEVMDRYIIKYFGDLKVPDLEYCKPTWEKFVDANENLDLRNYKKVFVNFLNWAIAEEYIDRAPKISIPLYEWREGKDLGLDVVWDMWQVADHPDLKDFIAISIMTGMRHNEVLHLSKDRVSELHDLKSLTTKDHESKTKQKRTIPVNESVWEILQRRMMNNPESPWIFPGVDPLTHRSTNSLGRPWKRMLEHLELKDVRPNDLRTTFVNVQRQQGSSSDLRTKYAGHDAKIEAKHYDKYRLQELQVIANVIDITKHNRGTNLGLENKKGGLSAAVTTGKDWSG